MRWNKYRITRGEANALLESGQGALWVVDYESAEGPLFDYFLTEDDRTLPRFGRPVIACERDSRAEDGRGTRHGGVFDLRKEAAEAEFGDLSALNTQEFWGDSAT